MANTDTNTNPLIKNISNELQYNEHKQWTAKSYIIKKEWIGSTENINAKFAELVEDNVNTYSWSSDGESFTIDRIKGDLSKLTHSYQESYENIDSEGNSIDDPIDESMGITPWTVTTETTDIGAVEYYVLKNNLSEAEQKKIKRERLAIWENAPIEYKNTFKYKTLAKGWIPVSQNESGGEDSPETLAVAQWIAESGRSTFPLTTLRVTHEEIVKGPSFKKGKINKNSLKKDAANITFPADEITKELDSIPDCPYVLTANSYPTKFMLTEWNAQVHDEEGKYLITKTYVSYPEAFPLPLDATPTNQGI
jgi:hypothetical protein